MGMREKLIEVKRILGMCVKQGIASECKGCPYIKSNSSCVDALMEDALTVINHLERKDSVQRWIPVTERLPEPGVDVLCWYEYFRYGDYNRMYQTYGIGCYYSDGFWSGGVSNTPRAKVLAWIPLPEPPKGE